MKVGTILQECTDRDAEELAPALDLARIGRCDHFVQFYEDDHSLVKSVGEFIGLGLRSNESAIVIATPEHRAELSKHLEMDGIHVSRAYEEGQYFLLDAAETLSKFMVNGSPDAKLFRESVGALVQRATRHRKLRAFGEMVALLHSEGNSKGAILLEQLWNDLGSDYSFSLFCAYPMQSFGKAADVHPFRHICEQHARVIPSESYTAQSSVDDRLRTIAMLQQQARTLRTEVAERQRAEEELKSVQQNLKMLNETLEERVLKRTQELVRANEELSRSNKELEAFAYVASHDLQEPLRMIGSYVQLLQKGYKKGNLNGNGDEYMGFVLGGVQRMRALINDLLGYSRVRSKPLNYQSCSLDDLLQRAISNLQSRIRESGARIEFDPLPKLKVDESQIMQLFQNLLSNAIKFKREETPHVRVSTKLEEKFWVFSIRDNGLGIESEYFDKIFQIFQRLHVGDQFPGTGIGLAICKLIVERHGGELWVESELGRGSCFNFTLPIVAAENKSTRAM
jgi:signal transduction histidine kinase